MSRHHAWLHREIGGWLAEGLIQPAQAEALRGRYPLAAGGWGRFVLSALGAVLIGLGVILLFAYNWAEMHRYTKLAVVFGALLAAHGLGLWLRRPDRPAAASEGLLALGTMLFGAGIWLVAQVYHMDEHYPTAFLVWGLGALALAWSLPSLTQALLAVGLVLVWQATETLDFGAMVHGSPWLLALGVLPLLRWLPSPVLAGAATSALLVSLALSAVPENEDTLIPLLVVAGGTAVGLGRVLAAMTPAPYARLAGAVATPGLIAHLGGLFLLTFPDLAQDVLRLDLSASHLLAGTALIGIAAWAAAFLARAGADWRPTDWLVAVGLVAGLVAGLALRNAGGWAIAAPFNLLLLAHGLALIAGGSHELQARVVVAGCLLLALQAFARYLDLFESLLSRGLVFLVVGGGLFSIANLYRRRRRAAEGAP